MNRSAQSTCCERSPQAKWQAGRHSFKSNAELQAFKRRYEVGCLQFQIFQVFCPVPFRIPFVRSTIYSATNRRKRRRSVKTPRSAWKRRCAAGAPPRRLRPRPRHRALGGPRCARPQRRLQSTRFEAWQSAIYFGIDSTRLRSTDANDCKKSKLDEDETPCMDFLQASYWNSLG